MKQKVVLMGATFGPITWAHHQIITRLSKIFDKVFLIPCGDERSGFDKATISDTSSYDRAAMLQIEISELRAKNILNVFADFHDLENYVYTRTADLDRKYKAKGYEVWHYIGGDIVKGGANKQSRIHTIPWAEAERCWDELNFVVGKRPGEPFTNADLPPHAEVLDFNFSGSSTEIRNRSFAREPIKGLVSEGVRYYIERHSLYQINPTPGISQFRLETPRIQVVRSQNPAVQAEMNQFYDQVLKPYVVRKNPNCIVGLGGDGLGIKANKELNEPIPFIGFNFGDMGFLMNDRRNVTKDTLLRTFNLYKSPALEVTAEMMDGSIETHLALNDVYVNKAGTQTVFIGVKVIINNETYIDQTLKGDGVIIATPAGSTAYTLSAGGKPIPLGSDGMALTGICIHRPLYWPGGVIPSLKAQFELVNMDQSENCKMRPMNGVCDSDLIGIVKSLRVRVSPTKAAEFALLPEHNYAGKLMRAQYPKHMIGDNK